MNIEKWDTTTAPAAGENQWLRANATSRAGVTVTMADPLAPRGERQAVREHAAEWESLISR